MQTIFNRSDRPCIGIKHYLLATISYRLIVITDNYHYHNYKRYRFEPIEPSEQEVFCNHYRLVEERRTTMDRPSARRN